MSKIQVKSSSRAYKVSVAKSVCDRNYSDGGAHTVRVRNGVFLCVSCDRPTKAHPTPTNKDSNK